MVAAVAERDSSSPARGWYCERRETDSRGGRPRLTAAPTFWVPNLFCWFFFYVGKLKEVDKVFLFSFLFYFFFAYFIRAIALLKITDIFRSVLFFRYFFFSFFCKTFLVYSKHFFSAIRTVPRGTSSRSSGIETMYVNFHANIFTKAVFSPHFLRVQ